MLFELKSIKDVDKPRQNNRKKPLLLCNSWGPFKWYHNDVHFVYAMNRFANIVSCGRVSNSALKNLKSNSIRFVYYTSNGST